MPQKCWPVVGLRKFGRICSSNHRMWRVRSKKFWSRQNFPIPHSLPLSSLRHWHLLMENWVPGYQGWSVSSSHRHLLLGSSYSWACWDSQWRTQQGLSNTFHTLSILFPIIAIYIYCYVMPVMLCHKASCFSSVLSSISLSHLITWSACPTFSGTTDDALDLCDVLDFCDVLTATSPRSPFKPP